MRDTKDALPCSDSKLPSFAKDGVRSPPAQLAHRPSPHAHALVIDNTLPDSTSNGPLFDATAAHTPKNKWPPSDRSGSTSNGRLCTVVGAPA